MNEWERVASEADENSPARHFGDLLRLHDRGKIRRYLFVYEFTDEDGSQSIRAAWSHDEALWALGAAKHCEHAVWASYEITEAPDD